MFSWVEELKKEVLGLDPKDFIEPGSEVVPEIETVVGEINANLQGLFTLAEKRKAEIKTKKDELDNELLTRSQYEERSMALQIEVSDIGREIDTIMNIFWRCIKKDFPKTQGKNIGIRNGGKVVVHDHDEIAGDIGCILKRMTEN